jgi:hypothetical protein
MGSDKKEFMDALSTAVEEAKKAADKEESGDLATSVWADVDGICKRFITPFKKYGIKSGDYYTFNNIPIRLGEDNSLQLDILKGSDIQLSDKKFAMYRRFGEIMEKKGYNPGLSVDSYSR